MLDGAARLGDMFERTAELGMDAIAMTDHGNVFGAYDFWSKAKAAGVKPIIGMEAYATPNTSRFDKKRVRWNDGGDDDVSGSGAYTHMTLLAENTKGMHNLFRLSSRASMEGFFYQPRADRELLDGVRRGPDRHHRLPVRRGADLAAHRRLREGPRGGRRLPGHPRQGQLLPRADGPRARHRDPGPRRPAAAEQGPRHPAGRHQRLPLRPPEGRAVPRAPALRVLGQRDERPEAVPVQRRRLLHQVPRRDARALGRPQRPARGLRQHPADRRALRRRVHRGQRHLHAALPLSRRARTRTPGSSRRSRRACASATRTASPTTSASRPTSRST